MSSNHAVLEAPPVAIPAAPEKGGAEPRPIRPWYQLHSLTWGLLLLQLATIGWARMRSETLFACGSDSSSQYCRFGAPFVDYTTSEGSRRDPATGVITRFSSFKVLPLAIAANLASYLFLLAASGYAVETWLRSESLWRLTIGRLFCLTAVVAAAIAIWTQRGPLAEWLGTYELALLRHSGYFFPLLITLAIGAGAVASLALSLGERFFRSPAAPQVE